jgi:hypothetical protein
MLPPAYAGGVHVRPKDVRWLLVAAGLAAGQQPFSSSPPVFPSGVEQVVVDVVVLDDRGAAVTGLSRDDLLLTEDGAPQQIASFEAIETQPSAAAPAQSTGSPVGAAAGASGPAPRRTLAIVFDDLALGPVEGERARAARGSSGRRTPGW